VEPPIPENLNEGISVVILTVDTLFAAAEIGDVEQAKELRRRGMGINGVDAQGQSGKKSIIISHKALHHAVHKGHMNMVVYLVGEGIQLNLQDRQGMTVSENVTI
jgi:hypothetical protein